MVVLVPDLDSYEVFGVPVFAFLKTLHFLFGFIHNILSRLLRTVLASIS